jgi:hypothetical protein
LTLCRHGTDLGTARPVISATVQGPASIPHITVAHANDEIFSFAPPSRIAI